jgi:3-phosphoshikimate 1-carboxyvinyltransferase
VTATPAIDTEHAVVRTAARLRGELRVPGDKSISHRALMLAALAEGESSIEAAGDGADVQSTARVMAALGVAVERTQVGERTVDYRIVSPGADGLTEPDDVLDCGNSGTTLRLVSGLLVGLPLTAILTGDASLRRRPVARIIEPLRAMGAELHARRNDSLPPVTVVGRTSLRAVDMTTAVPSAQVKSAILLAALRADGRTTVRERIATRDHTERMLRARGVSVERGVVDDEGGHAVAWSLEGAAKVRATTERVPGDISAAAFWLVAASIHPDAALTLRGVGVNPTRRAIIDLLRRMGADIDERVGSNEGRHLDDREDDGIGEPIADLLVRSSRLEAIEIDQADTARAIDEITVLCLAASQARGTTVIRGAAELRHKESDRLAGIAAGLKALGARVEVLGDDLHVTGPTRLNGAITNSLDDHRLAITFAIAGLVATGETVVSRPASAAISYPGFFAELERVRA